MTAREPQLEPRPGDALDLRGLTVRLGAPRGRGGTTVVRGVDLRVAPGECLALVGPSGSGKSVTARAVLGLSAPGAVVTAEHLEVDGVALVDAGGRPVPERRARAVRGRRVGYVGQEALGALDPLRPVGREVADTLRLHTDLSARERVERVRAVLARVGLDPDLATDGRLAGTLSGGMRQRALIAAAIVGDPALVVADEPTTALDAAVAVTVMETLRTVQDAGAGLLVITHDLGLVADWADRVAVIADGRIVETGPTAAVLESPVADVTRSLVAAARRARTGAGRVGRAGATARVVATGPADGTCGTGPADETCGTGAADGTGAAGAAPILQADGLARRYGDRTVVEGVSLAIRPGTTLGVVGASGSGKTTLVRMLLGLTEPTSGTVALDGEPWAPLPESARRSRRARVSAVVQDPGATFDDRWSVERVLADALSGGRQRRARGPLGDAVDAALARVELSPVLRSRSPRTLSGGQRQRLAIARALATEPEVLLLDEPVTALDATVQDAVLTLLERLQRETGTAMVFVSHDLDAVRRMSDTVLVVHEPDMVAEPASGQKSSARNGAPDDF